ncbi:hypothetical protein KCU78_g4943, partial [Aureobasidium melanogenum]
MSSVSSMLAVAASGTAIAILAHLVLDNYGHEINEAFNHASFETPTGILAASSDAFHQVKTLSASSWATAIKKGNLLWDVVKPTLMSAKHKSLESISIAAHTVHRVAQTLFDKALHAMVVFMCKWALALAQYLAARYLDHH